MKTVQMKKLQVSFRGRMVVWEKWWICAFSICNLIVRRVKTKEGVDLGAFLINIPNAVGLKTRALVYFALSHPCV